MDIHIYVDPTYNDTLWCKQTLKGISDEATKKRYSIKMLTADDIYSTDLDAFFDQDEKRILLVLATSVNQSKRFNQYFSQNGVHLLYINHQSANSSYGYSNIIVDYHDSMKMITEYLEGCGRNKIALYGCNPDSSTDLIKKNFFEERNKHVEPYGNGCNIFYRATSNTESSSNDDEDAFLRHSKDYDAAICVNDLVARLLIDDLERSGIRVPEDMYVVSFGDYILAQIGNPTITAVAIEHEHLGRQAVYVYSYLRKASDDVYVTAKVSPKLSLGESTAKTKYTKRSVSHESIPSNRYAEDFFRHPQIHDVITFENMLTKCDKLDMQILIGIMDGMTYIQLSEKLFVSENVISYRVKRLCKTAQMQSKGQLYDACKRFLDPDAIERYIKKKFS